MLDTGREISRSARTAGRPPYPPPAGIYDEMVGDDGRVRPQYRRIHELWSRLTPAEFTERRRAVDRAFLRQGITFNVYGDAAGAERIFPFDMMPRLVTAKEWRKIEAGLAQRITALNLFLHDVYHEQRIVKDGVVHTPILNNTFLPGVTRARIIDLLKKAGYDVQERTVKVKEVLEADEIFSSGNYAKVQPCTRIEDRHLQAGPVYKRARELYWDYAHKSA